MTAEDDPIDRNTFLNLAGVFQGGLVLLALALAWWLRVDFWEYVALDLRIALLAAAATLPLCGLSVLIESSRSVAAQNLRTLWDETLGPALVQCRWFDLILLSLLVGLSEELLFRGVLQMGLAQWNVAGALLITNVLFALAHAITPTYACLAGAVGLYLGGVMWLTDPPNLVIPILCHAGCDLFSFWRIRERLKRRTADSA